MKKQPIYPPSNHYNPHTQRFFNTPPTRPVKWGTAWALWQMLIKPQNFRPNGLLPMAKPDWVAFHAPSSRAKLIWLGHSSLLLRNQNHTFLIDPVYASSVSPIPIMMKRFQAPPIALSDLPHIDWVVYSHAHYDHLDADVVRYLVQHHPNTRYLVPLGVGYYLQKWGVAAQNIAELDWWQHKTLPDLTVYAVPARHDASRSLFDGKKSLWAGWVWQSEAEQIYFSGDSAYAPHFQAIGQYFGGFDLALMENGQYNDFWTDNHMFPHQTVQAVLDVQAKRWMPIHWGAYPLSTHAWQASVESSSQISQAQGLSMLTPVMGQVFDADSESVFWWENWKNPI